MKAISTYFVALAVLGLWVPACRDKPGPGYGESGGLRGQSDPAHQPNITAPADTPG